MDTSTPDSRYLEFDNVWEARQYIFYRKALFELFKEGNLHPSTEDIETKMEELIDQGLKDFLSNLPFQPFEGESYDISEA